MAWGKNTNVGLGLSLGGVKLVSTNDGLSIFSIIFRLFRMGGVKNLNAPHYARSPLDVLQGMPACRNRAKHRVSDLPVLNIKQNLANKTGSCTKSKYFEGNKVCYSLFTLKTPNAHAGFER